MGVSPITRVLMTEQNTKTTDSSIAPNPELAVQLVDLQFRYRGEKEYALEGITLQIPKGEFLVVMGASEAGKSTLAACLNGLIPHYMRGKLKGAVFVLGRNTVDLTI